MTEIWKPIPSNSDYEASTHGRVRSREGRMIWGGPRIGFFSGKGKILVTPISSNSYPGVYLGDSVGHRTVHSLVAETFLGPCPEGMEVLHNDGSRTNARLDNLRHGTRRENVLDAYRHGIRNAETESRRARKAADTKTEKYGPGWFPLGVLGIAYSKVYDL